MIITVHNLTSGTISISSVHTQEPKDTPILASSVASITVGARWKAKLHLQGDARVCEFKAFSLATRAIKGWSLLYDEGDESFGWRVYLLRSKEGNSTKRDVFVLPRRDLSSFLKDIADTKRLSELCLSCRYFFFTQVEPWLTFRNPATHDSLSLYGWPISQCQSRNTPFSVQLQSGIRVFDIRMAVVDGRLVAHHGIMPEKTSFQNLLSIAHAFLTDQRTCKETIVMSIKQEDFNTTPPSEFSKLVHDEIYGGAGGRDMWFLEDRIPQLGEVRGKIIMLSRFGGDGSGWENGLEGMGIHPTTWPDSLKEGFQWTCKDTLVRTSDWYNIPSFFSIPDKVSLATAVLLPPSTGYTQPTLNISFFSAGSFPLALPPVVAKGFGFPAWKLGVEGVNARLGEWLLQSLSPSSSATPRGWVFTDFFITPSGIAPLLVECNFKSAASSSEKTQ
ncbi:hypothetical protein ACEPAH_5140 [Sanghuangporus vaninii]